MAYVLLISEQKLKDSTAINLNVSTSLLLPYVLQAQTLYIEPKLGTQLYEHIKGLIQAGTIGDAGNVAYPRFMLGFFFGALACPTQSPQT